jgi:hypothetical protein
MPRLPDHCLGYDGAGAGGFGGIDRCSVTVGSDDRAGW